MRPLLEDGILRLGRLVMFFRSRWHWDHGTLLYRGNRGWYRNLGFLGITWEPKGYWDDD